MPNTHVVDQLRFEIRCSEEEQAFQMRHNLAPAIQALALEAIDSVCSRHVGDDEWLQIDTIDVDLGQLSQHAMERDFALMFRDQFEKALIEKLAVRRLQSASTSVEHSRFELFCYIALNGVLPWWAPADDVDLDLLVQELHDDLAGPLRAFFHQHRATRRLWRRLALQSGGAALQAIIALVPELKAAEALLMQGVESALWRAGQARLEPSEEALRAALEIVRRLILNFAPQIIEKQLDEVMVAGIVAAAVADGGVANKAVLGAGALENATDLTLLESRRQIAALAPAEPTTPALETDSPSPDVDDERYIVRHSGLVLFAPFFVSFFTNCELLDESEWKDKEAQYTAIHLLRYLCAGTAHNAEHDLILEKLCCGVAIDEPIPREVALRELHLSEAQSLLASVIEHWESLRNTSVDGLRETFLKRDGIITRQDNGWLLRVERKTLDVLIDRIPWGYSTLAMPWNDYVIHVEW